MKITIFVLSLLATAFSWNIPHDIQDSWIQVATPHYSKCMCASGADITAAENILGKLLYPNDPCLKCFAKCIEIELGLMLSDGTVVPEAWVSEVAAITPEIAERCVNDTIDILDTCEKAYDYSQCIVEEVSMSNDLNP
ncbi:hypothetical protein RN001_009541 [Aquatica leii]|uniref:Uncharacterized protein n=1 Tax=Aquatica leii TaxID=1421715 RepID=A0AAN7SPZ6_9COLE|nr:hypothetical protein RN001_009541 [Aquatica leii]